MHVTINISAVALLVACCLSHAFYKRALAAACHVLVHVLFVPTGTFGFPVGLRSDMSNLGCRDDLLVFWLLACRRSFH